MIGCFRRATGLTVLSGGFVLVDFGFWRGLGGLSVFTCFLYIVYLCYLVSVD